MWRLNTKKTDGGFKYIHSNKCSYKKEDGSFIKMLQDTEKELIREEH